MTPRVLLDFAFITLLALVGLVSPGLADPETPPIVLVADVSQSDPSEHLLATCLQGIANRDTAGPRVFLLTNPRDADWLQYSLRLAPRTTQPVTVAELLEILRPQLAGQILYDPDQPFTLDLATTAAGLHQAVIAADDLGLPTLLDLRGRWASWTEAYQWAANSLFPECNRNRAALLTQDSLAMRDFAIQNRMFTLSPPPSPEDTAFQDLLFHLAPGAAIYGDAPTHLRPALSRSSHYLVTASHCANLSYFSSLNLTETYRQYPGYLEPSAPRYLTLIFDCSNLDFAINDMPALWQHPTRGSLPLGWALPAALIDTAPPILHYYYADAYRSGLDQFILGPSGAGEIDLSAATAPYAFYAATARSRDSLDATASLYYAPAPTPGLAADMTRFAADTGARGVFVIGLPDFPPAIYDGLPVLAAPQVDSVQAAVTYLDRIPLERGFAALTLDPRSLTPADAAHIAAYVGRRFVLVPPEELIELMRNFPQAIQPGSAGLAVTSVEYPDPGDPDLPLPVNAIIEGPADVSSASVIYRPTANPLSFCEPLLPAEDGYHAQLPPLRCGGEIALRVRVLDAAGRVAWSPPWTLQVPRTDTDADGLADAEERYLLTDVDADDTDHDGLLDGSDSHPLHADQLPTTYFGPIRPPSDSPYLPEPGASRVEAEGRHLPPGTTCLYWLPLGRLPQGAPAVIALEASGTAAVAVGCDPLALSQQFRGDLTGPWRSQPLPNTAYQTGAFLRLTCPPDASAPLLLRGLSVTSPPEAPSISRVSFSPAHPGPEQPITISALIFSTGDVTQAGLTYRLNDRGEITIPMQPIAGSQFYQARIPALENRDQLDWWITAADADGNQASTARVSLPIGCRAREAVSLLAMRDFVGDWSRSADWEGAGRMALSDGLVDSAHANLTGGIYTIWILAGGRGQNITLSVDNQDVGSIDPNLPDGWQRIGRLRIEAGRHHVHLTSAAGPRALPGAAPRYAAVILSADPMFQPPTGQVLDIYNSLTLFSPVSGQTLTARVQLHATGAGNLTGVEFSLDGQLLRRVSGPPFTLSLNTARVANGPHTLRVEAVDRAGPTDLAIEIPVLVAN